MLTRSLCIAAGVAILMLVADCIVGAWADRKDRQYFYKDQNDEQAD